MKLFLSGLLVLVSLYSSAQEWLKHDVLYKETYQQGNFIEAEKHAVNCLKAAETECARHEKGYETALKNLAEVYEANGDLAASINYWSELFKLECERVEKVDANFGLVVTSYHDMFKTITEQKVALLVFKKVVERLKKIESQDAAIYYDITQIYSQAITEFYSPGTANSDENRLDDVKKKFGEASPEYFHLVDSLSAAYKHYGQFAKAKPMLLENLRIREMTGKNKGEEYARVLTNIGYMYFIGQKPDSAIYYYSKGIEIWKKTAGNKNTEFTEACLYHAMTYQYKQDWKKVCDLYEEVLPMVKSAFGQDHYWYSVVLVTLGSFNRVLKNYDKAEKYYLEDIKVKKQNGDTTEMNYVADYWGLAGIYDVRGDYDKAVFYFKKVNDFTLYNIQLSVNTMNISTEKKVAQGLVGFQFSLDWIYSFMTRHTDAFPELSEYIYNDELAKKGLVMRAIKSKMETVLQSGDSTLIAQLDKWLLLRQQIAKLSILPVSERKSNLATLEAEAKKLENDMFYKVYERQKDKKLTADWRTVQQSLKPGEAAIEFFNFEIFDYSLGKFPDSVLYYALVVRPEYKYPKMIYMFCGNDFQLFLQRNRGKSSFDQVRRLYTWPSGAYMDKNRGDSLYNFVWRALEPELAGIKTVYYSPSGLLHKISFSAVSVNDSTSLIDRYQLRPMTTTDLIASRSGRFELSEDYKAVLYGGIFYDLDSTELGQSVGKYKVHGDFFIRDRSFEVTDSIRGGGSWPYLEGTLKEVGMIDSVMSSGKITTKVLSKNEALEESFKYSDTFRPEIIHIATHGYFLPEPPAPPRDTLSTYNYTEKFTANTDETMLRSGLLFAGANGTWKGYKPPQGAEDGILTAYEVSKLNLSRTRLVVLSACETGLGEVKGSEGVYGLQRAFKLAGVDYIIMSLWQVPDEQTAQLMHLFYKKWLKGGDIHDAFHYAQQEMNKEYEPYFWAGFVLIE